MTERQRILRAYLEMCEGYLNILSRNSAVKKYYERERAETLKELLEVQIEEFDRS